MVVVFIFTNCPCKNVQKISEKYMVYSSLATKIMDALV